MLIDIRDYSNKIVLILISIYREPIIANYLLLFSTNV